MKYDMLSEIAILEHALRGLGWPVDQNHRLANIPEGERDDIFTLNNSSGMPYLLASLGDEAEDALREILEASKTISSAIGFSRDGSVSIVLRKSFRTGDVDVAVAFESRTHQAPVQMMLRADRGQEDGLRPLTHRLENVLFEVHSAMRDIDGLHAPDALDEICKILYAKLFDEEHAVKSGSFRFQRSIYHSIEECASAIRTLYFEAIQYDKDVFANRIPSYLRSRGVFRDSIVLSSQAIAKVVAILEEYDLSKSPVDIKGRAFQNVLLPVTRSGMGQYFTPKSVISLCIDLLAPTVRDVIVDPFCGSGHFLTAALDYVRSTGDYSEKQFHEFAFSRLHGLEKSDRMVRIAMTDMRLHGDGHSNIRCVDSLLQFPSYPDLYPETFDIVATNPPFGVDLPQEAMSELGPFEILDGRRAGMSSVSLEIVAIDRCLSLLRPGGRMAIVLPDSILSNRNTAYVREWIKAKAMLRAVVSLPIETFAPFGANIKTSFIVVRKYNFGEIKRNDYNVFLANLSSIGHDSTGRPVPPDDFKKMTRNFRDFIEMEGW